VASNGLDVRKLYGGNPTLSPAQGTRKTEGVNPVFGAGVDFVIVAWLVFWFSKKVLREETVTKK
jgi:hypothetical protein